MKYRRLTKEELQSLEKEFIDFLAANTITAEDWKDLKEKKPENAEALIDIFSDIAFDKILGKIVYLSRFSVSEVVLYRCGLRKFDMVVIRSEKIDIGMPELLIPALQDKDDIEEISLFKASKNVSEDRKSEVFKILSSGATPGEGELFEEIFAKIKN